MIVSDKIALCKASHHPCQLKNALEIVCIVIRTPSYSSDTKLQDSPLHIVRGEIPFYEGLSNED